MDIRPIDDEYSVSGQITVEDLDQIKAMGFKSLVCHRPDNESPDQTPFSAVEARAKELGLEITHVPVGPMGVTEEASRVATSAVDAMKSTPTAIALLIRASTTNHQPIPQSA